MKKLVAAVATVFVTAILVSVAAAGTPGGTLVAEGFACGVIDGNGSSFVTTNSELIAYDSGKAVLHCSGYGAAASSVIHWNYGNTGLSCGMLQFGSTTNWSDRVGRNGLSQLTCTSFGDSGDDVASAGAGIG